MSTRRIKTGLSLSLLGMLLISYQNCSKSSVLEDSQYNDIQLAKAAPGLAVLKANCLDCHNANADVGGVGDILDLEQLVHKRLLIPGEPELSPIVLAIQDGSMPPPSSAPAVSAGDLNILKDWVTNLTDDQIKGIAPGTGGVALTGTFQSVFTKIIQPKCMGCHGAMPVNNNIQLTNYTQIRARVRPNDLMGSNLYVSVTRTNNRMPVGGVLSPDELKALSDWIVAGAMDN